MKLNFKNYWLKSLGTALIMSAFLFAFFQPSVTFAQIGSQTPELGVPTSNTLNIGGSNRDSDSNLSSGGSGLLIPTGNVEISSSISKKTFGETLLSMVNYFTGFLGFLATLAFLYAGVLWVVSGGNDESITKAKKIMTYATLGIVVVLLSFSIVSFITNSAGTGGGSPSGTSGGELCGDTVCALDQTCAFDEDNNPVCKDLPYSNQQETPREGVRGGPTTPAVNENLNAIDGLMQSLGGDLDVSGVDISTVPTGNIDSMINAVEAMAESGLGADGEPLTDSEIRQLESFVEGLSNLKLLREEFDALEKNMPNSKEINEVYADASGDLDDLISDPSNTIKYRRFETKYKKLKELIRAFPIVQARIFALPGEGNVPFSVQLDGLDSTDPTGKTISEYEWTYLDSKGKPVSLGSDPVLVTDFTEPNTYAVRLRVAASQNDEGFDTALDGVSVVRIKANPPASRVQFRINGAEVGDIFNVTLQEAQAGISFDPGSTTPALGRKIEKYEWFFGDTAEEARNVPSTVVHTYSETGEYFVKLQVTDNLGVTDKRIVKLFVKSLAADIKMSPSKGNVNTEFNFVGVGSRSDDGLIKAYEWSVMDKEARIILEIEERSFSHRFNRPGDYEITLIVTDITGAQDKLVRTVSVLSRSPIANFTFEIPKQNHPNRVEFSAIDSYDPDEGDSIGYSWDFDGDGNFEIVNSKEALVSHEYNKVGEYRAKLQVEDAFGQRDQIEKKVSVQSVLSADITSEVRATRVGEPINFLVESENAVAYLWEFGDGETISTEGTSVSHTYNETGKFNVKLNFFDQDDNDNFDVRRILVGPGDEPMAVINYMVGGRQPRIIESLCGEAIEGAVVTRADLIRFDAKGSINTDGSSRLLSYDWKFPGGEKNSNKESTYKFDEINREGECFSVSLVVRDQLTGKLSKPHEIYFKSINETPQITDFFITPPEGRELVTPAKVKLKVINAKDSDGTIKKYRWWYYREGFEDEKLGVHSTSVPETDMTITSFGEADISNRYFFTVEITDNDNGIYETTERFGEVSYLDVKNGPNLSPVAEFNMDKTTISVGDSITFISRSYDPQGEELPREAFRWDFDGDGEFDDTTSGPQVNRQFNTPGEYEVRLKVTYRGLSSSATKTVFVEATNALPQAAFTYLVDGNSVRFDAGQSRFDPDLEDTTLRFEWDFDVNEDANGNGIKDDDVQSTEITPEYTYSEKGVYKVRLKTKDVLGMEGIVVRDVDLTLTEAERQKNTYQSLQITTPKHALTTLDIEVVPAKLEKGGSADVNVRVLNADGSPYNGQVFFELLEGSGDFTPNPVFAEDSKASSIFSASDSGKARIRIRATQTLYGDLTEEANLTVK